jgi:hypothetical protein
MRKTVSVLAALAILLAFSATAYGQSSIDGYSNEAGQVQENVQGNGTQPVSANESGGALPFTGLDLALIAAAGGVLAAGGLAMRRLTRAPGSA